MRTATMLVRAVTSFIHAPTSLIHAPTSLVNAPTSFINAVMSLMNARSNEMMRIRQVVTARLHGNAPATLIDDLVQKANLEALSSKYRPRSMGTAWGWLATLTARTVANHFRREGIHAKWLRRQVDVEDLPIFLRHGFGGFCAVGPSESRRHALRW